MSDKEALAEREARRQVQERFVAAYDEVKRELMHIPGVVQVGVGLRERGGVLTAEPVFRVYVEQKLPAAQIPAEHQIPQEIRGFPIDVIQQRHPVPEIGFNDENDNKTYKTKVGGIRIGIDASGVGQGTLGCFARLNSDNSVVLLSNHHVLTGGVGIGVGQPDYSGSWCCVCNEIAKTVTADKPLDCAIARLKFDVKFAPKIRTIKKADGTLELAGIIKGSAPGVQGDPVWKVGCTTGLTRGILSQVVPELVVDPVAPFPRMSAPGDSGSVYVNRVTEMVVGLHSQGDGVRGYPIAIELVTARLGITIIPTDPSLSFEERGWDEERLGVAGPPAPAEVFAAVADRLAMTEAGAELLALYRRHQHEISDLVNHCRPVTFAWHRNQGPTYLAAVMRSIREPIYQLPPSLNGVTREEIAERLREALTRCGSEPLRADLDMHTETLLRLWLECSTVDELLQAWEGQHTPAA